MFQGFPVMRRAIVSFFLLLCGMCPVSVFAGEVVACGIPAPAALPTEQLNYCDIYQRQLGYREVSLEQSELLKARQESFVSLQAQAYQKYQADLAALNAKRGAEPDGDTEASVPSEKTDVKSESSEKLPDPAPEAQKDSKDSGPENVDLGASVEDVLQQAEAKNPLAEQTVSSNPSSSEDKAQEPLTPLSGE